MSQYPKTSNPPAASDSAKILSETSTAPADSASEYASLNVQRISSFLSGEIEVPNDVPGWKLLCTSSTANLEPLHSEQSAEILTKHKRSDTADSSSDRGGRSTVGDRKIVISHRKDVQVPVVWEVCLLVLWEHIIKYSYMTQTVSREAFVERIKRISTTATRSLNQRGFFTLKHLMGITRAMKIYNKASESWKCRSEMSNRIQWFSNPTGAKYEEDCSPTWFCPGESDPSFKACIDSPDLRLLLLYVDTIVQAMRPELITSTGAVPEIGSRSWAVISVQTRPTLNKMDTSKSEIYHNRQNLSDNERFLIVQYYINPVWKKQWGGHLTLGPERRTEPGNDQDQANVSYLSIPSVRSSTSVNHILPTLDRLLMFYGDGRVRYRVNPMRSSSEVDERYAIYTWYYNGQRKSV